MNESKITVVKVGGKEIAPGPSIERLAEWTSSEARRGRRIVLVHGGGEEVSERAAALGLPTEKRRGQRVTSAPMLEVVLEVLAGRVNARLVSRLNAWGAVAVGLSGISGRMLLVTPAGDPPGSLGFVGTPSRVRPFVLEALLEGGFTPVVAPIGVDASGHPQNVNADLAASAIAKALRADLALVTDVPGVRDSGGSLLARITVPEARRMIATGVVREGMIPKLEAAEAAVTSTRSVWIGDLDGLMESPRCHGSTISSGPRAPLHPSTTPPHRGRAD